MRFDERDSMFSRLQLQIGTKEFEEYYSINPDKKKLDMELKMKKAGNMPKGMSDMKKFDKKSMMGTNSDASDHEYASSKLKEEYSRIASELSNEANKMEINPKKRDISSETMSLLVKEFVRLSGLDAVGIAKIEQDDLYSYRGFTKNSYKYGEEVSLDYKYAIIFAAPLELDYVNRSPHKELQMSAMLAYAKSSEVAARLTMYIKDLGYDALMDSSSFTYHSPLSLLAEKAGLGQMGRCNSVVNPKYGNRTKLAAVLTNIQLIEDEKIDFGLKEFCEICRKCESNCPAKAICSESTINEKGEKYWKHDEVACIGMWIKTKTNCGICMSTCPFSQGIDETLVSKMKDNPSVMNEILEQHNEKFGKRNYVKVPLNFMPNK